MRFHNKAIVSLGSLFLAQALWAVTPNLKENYQPIIDRNPFGLKPPPPPPTNSPAQPAQEKPKIDIFMTGIASVGHPRWPKRVFLKTQDAKTKKEEKLLELQEGHESEGIKVLSIDEINKKVRIQTDGGETLLTFATHGVAAPAAPAPGMPGQPGAPGTMPGQPGAVPPPLPGGNVQPVNAAYQPVPQTGQPATTSGMTPSNPSNFRSIPSRSIRSRVQGGANTGVGGNVPGAAVPDMPQAGDQPQMDPAEQYLRMHLDKAAKEKQGIAMPPLPPVQ